MRRSVKIAVSFCLLLGALAALLIPGVVTPFTPPSPPAWHQVHVGMQRSNILELVGAPHPGMYPEKPCDSWYREGALGSRRLFVWYDYKTDTAEVVSEYIWWSPGQRTMSTRKEVR